jgi:hypothetical protein
MYSLSHHVGRLLLLLASLGGVVVVAVGYDVAGSKLDRMGDDGLRRDASELQQLVVMSNERSETGRRQNAERAVIAPPADSRSRRLAFQVWDDTNRLAAASSNFATLPLDAAAAGFSDVSIDGHRWRVFTLLTGDRHWLRVAERFDARNALKRTLLAQLAVIGMIGIPLCAWIGTVAARRALVPVRMLAERIGERRPGHLASIGSDGLPRELDTFVAALNALLARFRRSDGQPAPPVAEH